jgi:hypothetical protein
MAREAGPLVPRAPLTCPASPRVSSERLGLAERAHKHSHSSTIYIYIYLHQAHTYTHLGGIENKADDVLDGWQEQHTRFIQQRNLSQGVSQGGSWESEGCWSGERAT